MTEKRVIPEFSTFCMLAERLCDLSMEDTLVMLVERIMDTYLFSENEASMEKSQERLQVKIEAGKPGLEDIAYVSVSF
ncbi:hypothetical protein C3L33_12479, partial [Rhododendron williamsianum]